MRGNGRHGCSLNGWFYDLISASAERRFLGAIRSELLAPLTGEIVELGAGTGHCFPYYGTSAHVRAIEPNGSMLAKARERAQAARATIELVQGDDAVLDDMPAQSADAVVAALVMCSVEDPARTLKRAARILKPTGPFVTIEHVRAEDQTARLQALLTPFWRFISGNCHLDRVLEPVLTEVGFSHLCLSSRTIPMPARRLLYGIATR
jgi:ubiquinone/menaquinone biosynthesis C-methylase UbiE